VGSDEIVGSDLESGSVNADHAVIVRIHGAASLVTFERNTSDIFGCNARGGSAASDAPLREGERGPSVWRIEIAQQG
jgi:hypothetical protein